MFYSIFSSSHFKKMAKSFPYLSDGNPPLLLTVVCGHLAILMGFREKQRNREAEVSFNRARKWEQKDTVNVIQFWKNIHF
jgi:hypothetical protein